MLDVLMVGAGIGGLTAARSLARGGASVALVERAARPSAAGAGIVLGGNAMACLDALELGSAVAARGRAVDEMEISDRTGRTLRRTSVALPGLPAPVAVHRHALHEALQDGVSGVSLYAGTTVEALREETDAVECSLSSGEVLRARLVVGADGIGSQIRKLAFGAPERAYAGYTCWRAVVPDSGVPHPVEMWGRGQRVGLVPLGAGQLYMFLVADAPAGTPGEPVSAEALRARFASFGGHAPAALARLGEAQEILHHDIDHLPRHDFGRGRVALLGDAAHAMTPNMGQGAGMAIEDGFVLAEALRDAGPTPEAVAVYRQRRAARVAGVARNSLRLGAVAQWSTPWLCWLRDALFRALPASADRAQLQALLQAGPA